MFKGLTALLLGAALLLAACGPSGSGGPSPDDPATASEVLRLANAARASGATCGSESLPPASPLRLESRLLRAAQAHSEDMLANGVMTHVGSDGSSPGERIARTGYTFSTWGENVARGQSDGEQVMSAWLRSEGHCRNIMNPRFSELGVARAGAYWTMVLAHPR